MERVAYNALPTQVTDDYSARQYYQQFNQIQITREWREFSTPHEDTDLLFGVLTGYPCCTSNLHQGWPKFVQNLWYATADNGLAALVYAPSEVTAKVADNVTVKVKEETSYPFDETLRFTFSYPGKKVQPAFFPFHLRIPAWCNGASLTINGKSVDVDVYPGGVTRISRTWKSGDVLEVSLPMEVTISRWYDSGAVVERGPLLYALKMNEKWVKKNMEAEKVKSFGEWYYEVTSDTPWNYALSNKSFQRKTYKPTILLKNPTGKVILGM